MKMRSRVLSALVRNETCCVHSSSRTIKTRAERYFVDEKEDQPTPGVLELPATSLGRDRSVAVLSASVGGKNFDRSIIGSRQIQVIIRS